MASPTTILLSFIWILPCLSSPFHAYLGSNHSKHNLTTTQLISTTHSYYALCDNFTSCDQCMDAEHTHNIHCSWIEHVNDANMTSSCIPTERCSPSEGLECCTSLVCCNCLSQPNCIKCGSQGLNASCLWDHTNTKCFTPNHTCSGM